VAQLLRCYKMSTLKADIVTASSTNGNLAISNQGTGGIAIDGMPHRNLIQNGDMRIAQRGTSFATLTASAFTLDRWHWNDAGTTAVVVTITQDTDVPTVAQAGTNFEQSIKIDCTTAEVTGSDDYLLLKQTIEASDVYQLGHGASGAQSITLSFWMKSTKTGIFCTHILMDDPSRAWTTEHTISSTNTWQKFTVTATGDTGGSGLVNDAGKGIQVMFIMAMGTDYDGATADTWEGHSASVTTTDNQVNLLDSTSNDILITGVQLEVGAQSSDFEHVGIGQSLSNCQRYFERLDASQNWAQYGSGQCLSSTTARVTIHYNPKRSNPTVSDSAAGDFIVNKSDGAAEDVTVLTFAFAEASGRVQASITVAANLTAGQATFLADDGGGTHESYIDVDSEF
jgi:hypothetical protein